MRFSRQRHAPGTSPGTLPEQLVAVEPIRVRQVRYSVDEMHEEELTDGLRPVTEPPLTTWIDVEGRDVRQIADLVRSLDVHPLVLEDIVNVGQRPKAEDFENSLFIVLDYFSVGDDHGQLRKEQVSLVVDAGSVLSFLERQSALFEPVHERLRVGKGRIRGSGSGYLAYALIDTVVDHLFPLLDHLGDELEGLEESILEDPTSDDRNHLHLVKRNLLLLRKSVWPLRDMLRNLMTGESELIGDQNRAYLRDVTDHAALALDILETYREMVASLNDLYLSSVSNRMNEVMKVLTIIATIFIPLSFVAGLYGMNFDPHVSPWNMPELSWYWGYPAALLGMAALVVCLVVYFRRRGWL
jgi:magnesium transporter